MAAAEAWAFKYADRWECKGEGGRFPALWDRGNRGCGADGGRGWEPGRAVSENGERQENCGGGRRDIRPAFPRRRRVRDDGKSHPELECGGGAGWGDFRAERPALRYWQPSEWF